MTIAMGVSANFQGMPPANANRADRSNPCAGLGGPSIQNCVISEDRQTRPKSSELSRVQRSPISPPMKMSPERTASVTSAMRERTIVPPA